jgi:hypothetical protein
MAYKADEVKWFQETADEMAKRIEDRDNTSNEAAVAYSRIGRICARALASDAALSAKRTQRATHVTKFQAARQARNNKGGAAGQAQGAAQTQNRASQPA